MPPVTIRVQNDLPIPTRVSGILVEFYDQSAVFQTSGTTDGDGEVQVSLPDDTYDVFLYKTGVTFLPKQPQQIVVDSLLSNVFLVSCHERTLPESSDPLKCRITGTAVGVGGEQTRARIVFAPHKSLIVLSGGNVVWPEGRLEVACNDRGYFDFELLRGQKYQAYILYADPILGSPTPGFEVEVPDQAGAALDVFLFPLPVSLSFSEASVSIALVDGADDSVDATVMYSNGIENQKSVLWASVVVENTDNTVVEAAIVDGKLLLTPLSPGTATITTVRSLKDSVFRGNPPDYTSDSILVTVT